MIISCDIFLSFYIFRLLHQVEREQVSLERERGRYFSSTFDAFFLEKCIVS